MTQAPVVGKKMRAPARKDESSPKTFRRPTPARVAKARKYLRANWSLIALHTLYQRWGLPTSLLQRPTE